MKKLSLTLIGLLSSGIISAGTMGPQCEPGNVTVPCETTAWDFGIQALYLKPLFDADRAYVFNSPFAGLNEFFNNGAYRDDLTDWNWGFRLEGSYHFRTGNDLTVNWSHIKFDNSRNLGIDSSFTQEISDRTFFTADQNWGPLTNSEKFDQVNVVLGQHVDFGMFKDMRFYGGLQYAKMEANLSTRNTNTFSITQNGVQIASTTINNSFNEHTEFAGVGPVFGIDYQYNLTDSFSVVANSQTSILYGQIKQYYNRVTDNPQGVSAYSRARSNTVVPSLEAKLGANYTYQFTSGTLNLQAGYQVLNYFNALNGVAALPTPTVTDFALYGPYFGGKWVGSI